MLIKRRAIENKTMSLAEISMDDVISIWEISLNPGKSWQVNEEYLVYHKMIYIWSGSGSLNTTRLNISLEHGFCLEVPPNLPLEIVNDGIENLLQLSFVILDNSTEAK